MTLNKQKGNMYGFVNYTWNPIRGRCSHDCNYCYMIPFWKSDAKLDKDDLLTDLGENNFIFVGSSTDMWAENVPDEWIKRVLKHCEIYPKNTYLFQTKNPQRFVKFREELIKLDCILGTTIETNRQELLDKVSKAPGINKRSDAMTIKGFRKMITIEPIMDFDVMTLISEIRRTDPEFVNIGADSKGHKLSEPSEYKIQNLIEGLKKFTRVNLKDNLKRIYSIMENNKEFKEKNANNTEEEVNEKMTEKEARLLKKLMGKPFKFPKIKNPEIKIPNEIKIKVRKNIIKILEDKQKKGKGDRNFFI